METKQENVIPTDYAEVVHLGRSLFSAASLEHNKIILQTGKMW